VRRESAVVWLTGLPSSGKTTTALALSRILRERGQLSEILDGDEIRRSVCSDLSFASSDRSENVRRVAIIAKYLSCKGTTALVAVIAPYTADRLAARVLLGHSYLEVYIDCPLATCQARDVKGLYAQSRSGFLKGLTGIDGIYQPPVNPDLTLRTDRDSVETCAGMVLELMQMKGYVE